MSQGNSLSGRSLQSPSMAGFAETCLACTETTVLRVRSTVPLVGAVVLVAWLVAEGAVVAVCTGGWVAGGGAVGGTAVALAGGGRLGKAAAVGLPPAGRGVGCDPAGLVKAMVGSGVENKAVMVLLGVGNGGRVAVGLALRLQAARMAAMQKTASRLVIFLFIFPPVVLR